MLLMRSSMNVMQKNVTQVIGPNQPNDPGLEARCISL
jgi:hypothetical protein